MAFVKWAGIKEYSKDMFDGFRAKVQENPLLSHLGGGNGHPRGCGDAGPGQQLRPEEPPGAAAGRAGGAAPGPPGPGAARGFVPPGQPGPEPGRSEAGAGTSRR